MDNFAGKLLLNRFRVDDLISSGEGYSRYRGQDLKRNLSLSIKVYGVPIKRDPAVLCFQQSSLTLQSVMHPNIIPFYGLYEDEGTSFVIEKFIEGPSLHQILRQRNGNPMPPEDALIYIKALANALETIHGYGLVHSSINPHHIQATRDGSVLLANFGFARQIDHVMTRCGVFDPPLFEAPEQLRGERAYPTVDIYALGILFFECVTGVHPFLGKPSALFVNTPESAEKMRQAHLNQPAPDPLTFNKALTPGLSQTLLTALAKDPKQRYQNAQEMLEIICAVLGTSPRQVAERIGGRPPTPPTQIVERGSFPAPETAAGMAAGVAAGLPGTIQAPYPAAGVGAPPSAPHAGGTQVVSGSAWQGGPAPQAGYAPPPLSGAYPAGMYVEERKPKRPAWVLPVIGITLLIVLLCFVGGVLAGMPILKEMLATATPTPTATLTLTPTATLVILPTTAVPVVIPTDTLPPPPPATIEILPPTLAPTLPPPPTSTPAKTAFKVTIRNNESYPIYAFRNGTLMGTDAIPPGKYIWYLNIPGGQYLFILCLDMYQSQCPIQKQVVVDQDVTINVP